MEIGHCTVCMIRTLVLTLNNVDPEGRKGLICPDALPDQEDKHKKSGNESLNLLQCLCRSQNS